MDRLFAVFGKFMLVVLIFGGIGYGAYSLGRRASIPSQTEPLSATPTQKAPATDPQTLVNTTPSIKPSKILTAGLGTESGLSFTKYQITIPDDWIPTHTTSAEGTPVDTLLITRGTAQIKIFQAATGGALCLYPGDADFQGPSSRYDTFTDITTTDGTMLRRSSTNDINQTTKSFTVCQKGTGTYGQPTSYGHMTITTEPNPSPLILGELDAIVATLKRI